MQAVQALKESRPPTTDELLASLQELLKGFSACAAYCEAATLTFPFTRAERQVRDVVQFLYPSTTLPPSSSSSRPLAIDLSKRQQSGAVDIETFAVGSFSMPRLLNGLWQLSSPAWGSGSAKSQDAALAQLIESGLSATDMADHYVRSLPGLKFVCGLCLSEILPSNETNQQYHKSVTD